MPTKRANSKKRKGVWANYKSDIARSKKRHKADNEVSAISSKIDAELRSLNKKKLPDYYADNYWKVAIKHVSKKLISKVINFHRKSWTSHFMKACLDRHEKNNYIEKR